MVTVVVLLLGFFAFLIFRLTAPQFAPLYSGLNFDDSAAIVRELQSLNVPFELRGEGETILVPRDRIAQLRMNLAENGLPTRGQVGYEIFDEQSTLGATSFVQNINQVRALEGELARTISSLARIKSARVHLVLPQRELFRRDTTDPTASIVLGVRGELSAGEIRAVQHLVASAIEGLSPNRVSIVDDSGRLLASGAGGEDDSVIAGEMEEKALAVESRLRARVEELLSNVVGPGRARVQVSAELDMSRLTRTSETFDPESQVVRSSNVREVESAVGSPNADGGVSVANELPGGSGGQGGTTSESSNTLEETYNYEISRTTQTEINEAGSIKRLSVAVAIDGVYTRDAEGAATYQPRSPEQVEQIQALVRSAVGFDANRGDQVEVVNIQFAERPDLSGTGTAEPGLFDFTRDDLMNLANLAVTVLVSLALMFFVLRPLLKRVIEPESEPLALPQSAEYALTPGELTSDPVEASAPPPQAKKPEWMDQAKMLGEAQMQTLKTVGSLVDENPKQATLIVRDWLNSAA